MGKWLILSKPSHRHLLAWPSSELPVPDFSVSTSMTNPRYCAFAVVEEDKISWGWYCNCRRAQLYEFSQVFFHSVFNEIHRNMSHTS